MFVVISYDLPSDKRRTKLAKLLSAHGDRVQYSVFETHLDARDLNRLRAKVRKLIDPLEDSVRFYKIPSPDEAIEIEGLGAVTEKLELIII